jgi:hypothetical protein
MDDNLRGTPNFYPHILITYYHFRDIAIKLAPEGYVLGDSGGFSIRTFGMYRGAGPPRHQRRVDPVDVVQWQANMCNVGLVLDMPPVDSNYRPTITAWKKGLALTVKNTARALPAYERIRANGQNPFRWWGLIHGWTDAQRDTWRKAIADVYPFNDAGEGWSIRARPTAHDPVSIAWAMRYLAKNKIKRAHFLAAAGLPAVGAILALGPEAGLEFATCDSLSAVEFAKNRKIILPSKEDLKTNVIIEREVSSTVARDYLMESCPCFSCIGLRKDVAAGIAPEEYDGYWLHRFLLHNQLYFITQVRLIEERMKADKDATLRALMGATKHSEMLRAFSGHGAPKTKSGLPRNLMDYL